MKAFLFAVTMLYGLPFAKAEPQLPTLYSTDYWRIAGQPDKITWVEIHNRDEAQTSGIAHVMVLARKKSAPIWEVEHVCDHLAITTPALERSVTRPFKTKPVYPERFFEGYDRWKADNEKGKAVICSTSIQEFLQHQ